MGKQVRSTNEVRRKLLKAIVYAPPVILGSMVATPRTVMGAIGDVKVCQLVGGSGTVTITISSGTNACCPCVSQTLPDGTIVYSTKWDPVKCAETQCEKSCGLSCTPAMLAATDCKDFCKNCGFIVAGCNKPCTCTWNARKGEFKCR